jgi:hypothetical protein
MNILSNNTINIAVPGNNLGSSVNVTAASTNINSTVSISLNATNSGADIGMNAADAITLGAGNAINLNATNAGADIILTANDSINLVAPRVLINGSPSTSLSFFYQWNGAEQAINGNGTLGDGSFLGWDTTLYQTPGYGSRFNAPDTSTWICPVAGVYLVTVNLLCNLQNAINGMSVDLIKLSGGVTSRVGCQMRPAGYKATTAPPSPADLPMYQTAAGVLVGTFYTPLAVNDGLRLNGGTFSPGGFLYVQPMSTWSLQYIAAQ